MKNKIPLVVLVIMSCVIVSGAISFGLALHKRISVQTVGIVEQADKITIQILDIHVKVCIMMQKLDNANGTKPTDEEVQRCNEARRKLAEMEGKL